VLIPCAAQCGFEAIGKIVDVLRRCQRAHDADAEDFSRQRTEAAGDFDAVLWPVLADRLHQNR
jgi:hypothetical protein